MNFGNMKNRVAAEVNRDDLGIWIPDWINETREKISLMHQFSFLFIEKTVNLASATYSYAFDTGTTIDRYSGLHSAVMYYNTTTTIKLPYVDRPLFDKLFPTSISTADPTAYTVKGEKFQVNQIPSVLTSKTFLAKYYALPDLLSADSDEKYIDKKYFQAIIAGAAMKAHRYTGDVGAFSFWEKEFNDSVSIMIAQDTGGRLIDKALRQEARSVPSPAERQ